MASVPDRRKRPGTRLHPPPRCSSREHFDGRCSARNRKTDHHRPPPSPCLAPGTELLGQYEASAFTQPRYLLRRPDGQVIQVTRLLYLVASCLDGGHALVDIAGRAQPTLLGRPVSVDNVNYLIEHKLEPLGVVAADADTEAPLTRSNPLLLGLRFRTRVVPERVHRGVSTALRPLFWPPLVIAVAGRLRRLGHLAGRHPDLDASSTGVQQAILHPDLLLVVIAISVAVGFFHEIGHATAARYGGAKPGVMGVGIYLMLPVFYTDVTDSYRLNRRGRLRTDLGGLYFNTIAVLITAGVYQVTHFPCCWSSSASRSSRCCTSSFRSCAWTATTWSAT